jgi:two-component system, sensor histidine kinase and response regulator
MESLKVLVVDDEPGIRSGVTRILSRHIVSYPFMDEDCNFTCFEAASGEEGIEIIDAEMPDILLLDNKLPGIKGTQVLEYIRQKNYNIMVAMITSYASLEIALKATSDGAYDFIPKPFTPQELKASIDNITKQLFLRRISSKMKAEGKKIRYQFLSVLSHELKAPLNAIEGYLHIMKEKQAGNDIAAYEDMINRALERVDGMRNLTMDLLDFTRIRLDNRKDKIRILNLREIARVSVSTVRPFAIQKNISIKLEMEEKIEYEADQNDMEIIFNNLLSNAVKYNKDNGTVIVKVVKLRNAVVISVSDEGIGMTEDEISQLFKEFVRIKNEKTKNITGSGLGLSIVRKISDIYHGKISVTSKPDAGTTFTVELPVK